MQVQTLDELKAENAGAEAEVVETPQVETEEAEAEAAEEATEENLEAGEQIESTEEAEPVEAWMQTEEQASDSGDVKFTDHDVAAAKRGLRAKLEKKHNRETDELKAEIEALKAQINGSQPPPQQGENADLPPKLEDFNFDEQAHTQATAEWYRNQMAYEATKIAATQKQQEAAQAQQRALNDAVDSHYERAATLIKESGISQEAYQGADMRIKQAIDEMMPGKGELVTDGIIASLGDGSEKTMYYLGNPKNAGQLKKFQNLLAEDPSGLKAAIFLGQVQAKVTAKPNIKSKAPAPAAQVRGDANTSHSDAAAKKKYDRYHKEGKIQEAFNVKREAKRAGADTSNW